MPVKSKSSNDLGLVHVYTGDGKGKTTAALGLAFRALGHNFSVLVVQFMKGGRYFGELANAEKRFKNKLQFAQFGQGCSFVAKIKGGKFRCGNCRACFMTFEEEKEQAAKALAYADKNIKSGKFDIVILDEINVVLSKKQIDEESVLKLIMSKPKNVELILTGRGAPADIVAVADYVTEMRKIKHPFDRKKITGRRGIEY